MNATEVEKKFEEWLSSDTQKKKLTTVNSYIKAIEILSNILAYNIFEVNNLETLEDLYEDLKEEQRKVDGKYYVANKESYGLKGFYSAAIKSYIEFLQKMQLDIQESKKEEPLDENKKSNDMNIKRSPLNQILYGPPGTGKTYNTINKALEIIDGNIPSTRAEAKKRFDELRDDGQIVFTTFHQSFGYEEFVEGIKAIPIGKDGNEDGDEMIYAVVDGIFKKLSKKSLEDYVQKNVITTVNKKKFILNAKALNIQAKMIEDDTNTYRVLKGSKIRKGQAPSFDRYNYIILKNNVLKQAKLKEENEFYILEEDYVFQSMSAASSVILGRQSNGYNDWKEIAPDLVTNDDSTKQTKNQNYILIIDEINRGNISKIFGELITLIEPSKRLGEEEEIQLKLPYSNDLFGVPSNLYIIGTMNTADRSIAQIDTALRRRFEFVEMMPDYTTLDGLNDVEGINVPEMLRAINERICYLYDREHQIGHSYFLALKNEPTKAKLDGIFRVNIIPLLAEYFYGDWGDIRTILNNDFVKEKGEAKFKIEASRKKKNVIFEVNSEFKTEQYTKIYETNND